MAIKLYNTLFRKKQIFKPIKKTVGIYTCGPTVYSYQHIGNLRAYIFADILKKVLKYNGYNIKQVMNVTDVGHLTLDTGEDKIEKAAKKEKKSAKQIANYYLNIFKQDFKKLNISEPNIWAKATEHIKEEINLIKVLEKNGFTYRTKDGIYFDTSKFKNYGQLAKLDIKGLQAGKRIKLKEKKNITDFSLWKFSQEKRQQEWNSPWGIGFPGWHIECSAMSLKYLGNRFDIHTGGIDHIPVHHTNEIAQNQAAIGRKVVNFWIHNAFLNFKGKKVSKSTGGLFTLSELKFNPLSFRYLTLITHYRSSLNFSLKSLEKAERAYKRLKNIVLELKDDRKINKKYLSEFKKAINNDLDMPKALSVLWNLIKDKKALGKVKTIEQMDKIFSLDLFKKQLIIIPKNIKELIKKREKARKQKNWKESDNLREKIQKFGYQLEDTKKGIKIKKI